MLEHSSQEGIAPGCCSASYLNAFELLGRRWSGAIVAVLLGNECCRFSELRARVPGVADKMLATRLRELESEGILVRHVCDQTGTKVSYVLTEKGKALGPALEAFALWARQWHQPSEESCGQTSATADSTASEPLG